MKDFSDKLFPILKIFLLEVRLAVIVLMERSSENRFSSTADQVNQGERRRLSGGALPHTGTVIGISVLPSL